MLWTSCAHEEKQAYKGLEWMDREIRDERAVSQLLTRTVVDVEGERSLVVVVKR